MQLYILDRSPIEGAKKLYYAMGAKYSFKMMVESMQLCCSSGLSTVYKPIPQGKAQQYWVSNHPEYMACYLIALRDFCIDEINIKPSTLDSIRQVISDVAMRKGQEPIYGVFRYSKGYEGKTQHKSDVILPIDDCIAEYENYLQWKIH